MYFSILNYLGSYNKGICMGNSQVASKNFIF